jgi:hypothetical protein
MNNIIWVVGFFNEQPFDLLDHERYIKKKNWRNIEAPEE